MKLKEVLQLNCYGATNKNVQQLISKFDNIPFMIEHNRTYARYYSGDVDKLGDVAITCLKRARCTLSPIRYNINNITAAVLTDEDKVFKVHANTLKELFLKLAVFGWYKAMKMESNG